MKPLDIVRTPSGAIGWITEVNKSLFDESKQASINFIGNLSNGDKNAWWPERHLEVIDSIPRMLALATCHPSGSGRKVAKESFPLENQNK